MCDGLERAVRRAGGGAEPCAQRIRRLMVRAVDEKVRAVQRAQKAAAGRDGVQAVAAVQLAVAANVLAQRAAEVDVEDLEPPADADDRLSGAQEKVDERKLARVALVVDVRRAVDRLAVEARVHVSAAGEQENVRRLDRFRGARADQRERVLVVFQAYR